MDAVTACIVGQIISCSCLFEVLWGGIRKPDLSSRLFPRCLTYAHTLCFSLGWQKTGAFLELCHPLTSSWLLSFLGVCCQIQVRNVQDPYSMPRCRFLLISSHLWMVSWWFLPFAPSRYRGVCCLFLPDLFNRHEIFILQKEKKERKCISFWDDWILHSETCENMCSREKIIFPWKKLS